MKKKMSVLALPKSLNYIHLEIEDELIKVDKACGPECIKNIILSEIADSISILLTDLFNNSLTPVQAADI